MVDITDFTNTEQEIMTTLEDTLGRFRELHCFLLGTQEQMSQTEEERAYHRYALIKGLLHGRGDELGLGLLDELVQKASRYVSVVITKEDFDIINRFRMDPKSFKEASVRADVGRRISHDTLIDQLKITNRYLFKHHKEETPVGGVYSLEPQTIRDRIAVGDWAGHLVLGIYDQNEQR